MITANRLLWRADSFSAFLCINLKQWWYYSTLLKKKNDIMLLLLLLLHLSTLSISSCVCLANAAIFIYTDYQNCLNIESRKSAVCACYTVCCMNGLLFSCLVVVVSLFYSYYHCRLPSLTLCFWLDWIFFLCDVVCSYRFLLNYKVCRTGEKEKDADGRPFLFHFFFFWYNHTTTIATHVFNNTIS